MLRLAVCHYDCSLMASISAEAAAVALFIVDLDNFTLHWYLHDP